MEAAIEASEGRDRGVYIACNRGICISNKAVRNRGIKKASNGDSYIEESI
jgi:hypothetical protein